MNYTNINSAHVVLFLLCQLLLTNCKKGEPINKDDWELTFSEEFADTILNRTVWDTRFEDGQAYDSEDQQLFIDSAFLIRNGILHILVKRDSVIGLAHDENYINKPKLFYYTSGMLQSSRSFAQQFGYFEIRAKVPFGLGFWPAFWLLPYTSWPPEIDVFEILGREPNRLHMANHFRNKDGDHEQNSFTFNGPDFTNDFHTFAIEWNPKEITWYLDNERVFKSVTGVPDERMFLILTLVVGGGAFSGVADHTTPLPNSLDVDYIRVYRKK